MALRLTAKFITTAEAAQRAGLTMRRVRALCNDGKVPGAIRFGGVWMVPSTFRWKDPRKIAARRPRARGK